MDFDSFPPHLSPIDTLNIRNDKWFVNLSSIGFPLEATLLLQLGEKFSLPSNNLKRSSLVDFIKYFEYNANRPPLNSVPDFRSYACHLLSESLSSLPALSVVEKNLLVWANVTKKFLLEHTDIIVTRADKGNVTVALDRAEYMNKMSVMRHML